MKSTEQICSPCWTQSLPAFFTTEKPRSILQPEIRSEFAHYIMGIMRRGAIVFASEAKIWSVCVRASCRFRRDVIIKRREFVRYCDITEVKKYCKDDLETVCKAIHEKLVCGIQKRLVADAKVGFLLSGGLDSSLVCADCSQKQQKSPSVPLQSVWRKMR